MMKHSIYIKMRALLWETHWRMEQQTSSFKAKEKCRWREGETDDSKMTRPPYKVALRTPGRVII